MNIKYAIISILTLAATINGLAQDKFHHIDELRDVILEKVLNASPSIMLERSSIEDADTPAYDFCETNEEGMMLYYRQVDQDYCELVAGPEKYAGVVRIPSYVTERHTPVVGVGYMAFLGCNEMTEAYLPNTMLYLETASFYGCENLKKVDVGENLVAIGRNAFEGCGELTSINIPQSLEYVGYEAFYGCPKMITPLYNDKYFFYYPMMRGNMNDGVTYTIPDGIEVIGEGAFIFTFLDEVIIPNTVKTISDYAFDGSLIKRVTIPPSVETIGNHAFGQTSIEEVLVPSSVRNFGLSVFYCSHLKKAILENPLDSIPENTFGCCTRLIEVTYPSSVHKLGNAAFASCHVLPQLPDLSHINTLGVEVFSQCYALESISIPSSISYIPVGAFSMCTGVKEVNLPLGLERIDNQAFYQCSKLESITIPSSVKSIGLQAFSYGNKLKDFYVPWQNPILLENDIFDDYQYTSGTILHVPAGTAERYASAPYWSKFINIVEDVSGISHIESEGDFPHRCRPEKRLVDGKIIIVSNSSGTILPDGRKISN